MPAPLTPAGASILARKAGRPAGGRGAAGHRACPVALLPTLLYAAKSFDSREGGFRGLVFKVYPYLKVPLTAGAQHRGQPARQAAFLLVQSGTLTVSCGADAHVAACCEP